MTQDIRLQFFTKNRFSAKSIEYETPQDLFDGWNKEFNFTLDVCSTHENAKCANHFTLAEDGLKQPWNGVCWCNPPYGAAMPKWIRKALWHAENGDATTCLLIPARTNTAWWHELCMKGEIRFLRGRPKFNGGKHGLPFPLALVIFRKALSDADSSNRCGSGREIHLPDSAISQANAPAQTRPPETPQDDT